MKRLFLKVNCVGGGLHIIPIDQIKRISPIEKRESTVKTKIILIDGETELYSDENQEDIYHKLIVL